MSSPQRRAEKKKEWEAEQIALDAERHRKESLSMYARIEEAHLSSDLQDILHRITQHIGLED